jgi:galactokinase
VISSWFVPGRIEVFGKHTDYAGGRSLVCAVPRGITVTGETASGGTVRIEDLTAGSRATIPIAGGGPVQGWRQYPVTVVRRLAANFPGVDLSARIRISSTLARAAGISSSSALIVAIAETLIELSRIEQHTAWRAAIHSLEDRAAYFGCIENGGPFAALAGDAGVGTSGGSEDHAAIVMSRTGELRQFSFAPLTLQAVVPMPVDWTFVVLSSGVHAHKAGRLRDHYNRLAIETSALANAWRDTHPGDRRPLGQLAVEGELAGWHAPSALRSRLEHFVAEDARVAQATQAFARADISTIADLAAASQADADRRLGNQVPETSTLVSLARDIGAAAASAFGAGWGGSVWALVKTTEAERFLDTWSAAYQARYPDHHTAGFVSPPSAGAHRTSAAAVAQAVEHPTRHPNYRTTEHPNIRTPHLRSLRELRRASRTTDPR